MKQWVPAPGRTTIKIIAVLFMFCDHFAFIFVNPLMNAALYRGLRMVGRLSFPLFCFVLVQGFLSTRDVRKYILRLSVFALLSEIPYDLAFFKIPFYWGQQNVFFTLLIGMLVLVGVKRYETSLMMEGLITAAGCIAAYVLNTDYSWFGVLMITLFYLLRGNKVSQFLGPMLLIFAYGGMEAYAVLALPICYCYNPQKEERRLPKYFFYAIYPLHLLVMYGVWLLITLLRASTTSLTVF